mmetsp:Transcript_7961/g.21519  ORF Transcript_7961/g.21519 Transcript_7961/m.21519 type:complete len:166 (-) Transcript_7961:130-627(-)
MSDADKAMNDGKARTQADDGLANSTEAESAQPQSNEEIAAGASTAAISTNPQQQPQQQDGSADAGGDDDDDDLMDVEIPMEMLMDPGKPKMLPRPSESMAWDNSAIHQCFAMAMASHDATDNEDKYQWQKPLSLGEQSMEVIQSFHPPSVKLPLWAVDPYLASVQ